MEIFNQRWLCPCSMFVPVPVTVSCVQCLFLAFMFALRTKNILISYIRIHIVSFDLQLNSQFCYSFNQNKIFPLLLFRFILFLFRHLSDSFDRIVCDDHSTICSINKKTGFHFIFAAQNSMNCQMLCS